jgi:hypothetical protein
VKPKRLAADTAYGTAKELPRNNCFMLRLGSNAGRWCNSTLDGKCRR